MEDVTCNHKIGKMVLKIFDISKNGLLPKENLANTSDAINRNSCANISSGETAASMFEKESGAAALSVSRCQAEYFSDK